MTLGWYWRRLSRMSAGEVAARLRTAFAPGRLALRRRSARPCARQAALLPGPLRAPDRSASSARQCRRSARRAHRLCRPQHPGRGLAGVRDPAPRRPGRAGLVPRSADRHARAAECLLLCHPASPARHRRRSETCLGAVAAPGDRVSLATAWWLTGDARYAEAAARHLTSWWRDNPLSHGYPLDQRHRAGPAPPVLGLDPGAARGLARLRQAV